MMIIIVIAKTVTKTILIIYVYIIYPTSWLETPIYFDNLVNELDI